MYLKINSRLSRTGLSSESMESGSPETRYILPLLVQYWAIVVDVGPTLIKHWAGVSCLLGCLIGALHQLKKVVGLALVEVDMWRLWLVDISTNQMTKIFISTNHIPMITSHTDRDNRPWPVACLNMVPSVYPVYVYLFDSLFFNWRLMILQWMIIICNLVINTDDFYEYECMHMCYVVSNLSGTFT